MPPARPGADQRSRRPGRLDWVRGRRGEQCVVTEVPTRPGEASQSGTSQSEARPGKGTPRKSTPRKVGVRAAARILAERDPVLARLIDEVGLPSLPRSTETHFATLVRSIVYQQLAGAAAGAIHGRLLLALGGEVTPERMLTLTPETLRAAGLSGRKAATLLDLA